MLFVFREVRTFRDVIVLSGWLGRQSTLEPCLFRVLGLRFRVSGLGFGVSGLGFRVSGLGFGVSGLGFRV